MGRLNNDDVLQRGGAVRLAEYRTMRVQEIVRCTVLAMRRRREIMGPACQHDLLTDRLVRTALRRSTRQNHWSQAWAEAQIGMAYACAGKVIESATALQKSLLAGGQFDHPVTGAALLQLGKLLFEQGKYEAAAVYFHEATLTAAQFGQMDDIEEAFRFGAVTHMIMGKRGVYPPLALATKWASRRSRPLNASLLLLATENSLAHGETAAAASLLKEAHRAIGSSDMRQGQLGARYQFQAARVYFQQGKLEAGTAALSQAMGYQRRSSKRLFQISLVDNWFTSGDVSPRVANDLFHQVLREPTASDWTLDTMETLGVAVTPNVQPLEHWFELTLVERKDRAKALEISDRIRRHRFYSTLPLGGRLLCLRWILEAPKAALSDRAILQRQDLLLKYPTYAKLSSRAKTIRGMLRDMELTPKDEADSKAQTKLLVEWSKISAAQELILNDMALNRLPSEFVFPPLLSVKEIQQGMDEGQLTLAFLNTNRGVFAFMLSKTRFAIQPVKDPVAVKKGVVALLRSMGHYDNNQPLDVEQLTDDSWRQPAKDLLEHLATNAEPEIWSNIEELVVVPDGILWYVPFESLQVPRGDKTVSLISLVPIRYAPTISTTIPDKRRPIRLANTAVVAGKLFPRDDEETSHMAFDELRTVLPDAQVLDSALPAPSGLFAALCDQLIVLDDIEGQFSGTLFLGPHAIGSRQAGKHAQPVADPSLGLARTNGHPRLPHGRCQRAARWWHRQ